MRIKHSSDQQNSLGLRRPGTLYAAVLLILAAILIFELASLAYWIAYPYFSAGESVADLEQSMFNVFSNLSPILLVGLLYLSLFRVILPSISRIAPERIAEFKQDLSSLPIIRLRAWPVKTQDFFRSHLAYLLLALALVMGMLIVYSPYRLDLNPTQQLVGIDTPVYLDWLVQMLQKPFPAAVAYSFGTASEGSRPLFLLTLYALSSLGNIGPEELVRIFPMLMSPLLGLSVFLFARVDGTPMNRDTALVSALLAVLSFDVTVGMWAGFYANWFAMILSYLFFAVLLAYLKRPKSILLSAVIIAASQAMFLVHPWTWLVILSIALIFTFSLRKELKTILPLVTVIAALGLGFVIDYLERLFAGGTTLASDLATKGPVFGPTQLLPFSSNLYTGLFGTYQGLLSNALIFSFALLAVPFLSYQNRFHRLLLVWFAVSSLVYPFFDSFHQTRILYDLPFPVMSAVGLFAVVSRTEKRMLPISLLLILIVLAVNASYALRAMFLL